MYRGEWANRTISHSHSGPQVFSQGLLFSSQRPMIRTRSWLVTRFVRNCEMLSHGCVSSLAGNLITYLNRACLDWYSGLYSPPRRYTWDCGSSSGPNILRTDPTTIKKASWPMNTWKNVWYHLAICEVQTKIVLRLYLTSSRKNIIKKTNKSNGRHDRKIKEHFFWWECKLVWPLWKKAYRFFTSVPVLVLAFCTL